MLIIIRSFIGAAALVAAASFAFADATEPATERAGADAPPPTTSVTVTAPPPEAFRKDPNEVICKRIALTGTRVATQKLCFTRREWDEGERDAGAMLDRWQHQKDNTKDYSKPFGY